MIAPVRRRFKTAWVVFIIQVGMNSAKGLRRLIGEGFEEDKKTLWGRCSEVKKYLGWDFWDLSHSLLYLSDWISHSTLTKLALI